MSPGDRQGRAGSGGQMQHPLPGQRRSLCGGRGAQGLEQFPAWLSVASRPPCTTRAKTLHNCRRCNLGSVQAQLPSIEGRCLSLYTSEGWLAAGSAVLASRILQAPAEAEESVVTAVSGQEAFPFIQTGWLFCPLLFCARPALHFFLGVLSSS